MRPARIGPTANSTVGMATHIVLGMAAASPWIAIVDDDPAVLRGLARLLRTHALQTRTYASAHEFLAAMPSGLPECLIVDWQMPDMNGLELLQQLRRQGIQVPTIVISAHGSAGAQERCISAGARAFLAKPLQDTELLAAIAGARSSAGTLGP
jgi:FixJ family two-component response regulator